MENVEEKSSSFKLMQIQKSKCNGPYKFLGKTEIPIKIYHYKDGSTKVFCKYYKGCCMHSSVPKDAFVLCHNKKYYYLEGELKI